MVAVELQLLLLHFTGKVRVTLPYQATAAAGAALRSRACDFLVITYRDVVENTYQTKSCQCSDWDFPSDSHLPVWLFDMRYRNTQVQHDPRLPVWLFDTRCHNTQVRHHPHLPVWLFDTRCHNTQVQHHPHLPVWLFDTRCHNTQVQRAFCSHSND